MEQRKLLFLGDTVLSPGMKDKILPEVRQLIDSCDLVVPNLEGTLAPEGARLKLDTVLHTGSITETFPPAKTLLCLANNHIGDGGREAMLHTMAAMRAQGYSMFGADGSFSTTWEDFEFFGVGWDLADCPVGPQIGVMSLSRTAELLQAIRSSRARFKVVIAHWGIEFERLPLPTHRQLAHALVEAGANLIIGHHPHCVQGHERYRNVDIFYSLGNFWFEQIPQLKMNVRFPLMCSPELGVAVFPEGDRLNVQPISFYYDRERRLLSLDPAKRAEAVLAESARHLRGGVLDYELRYRLLRDRKTLPVFSGPPGSLPYRIAELVLNARKGLVHLLIRTGLKTGYRKRD